MKLFLARLTALSVLFSVAFSAPLCPCWAEELSDAEVDALFKRHPDTQWKVLADRWKR